MREGVRRLLVVTMTVVDTKYRCVSKKKKPLMVVPFVVDERVLLKQRGEREREGEVYNKRDEYGRFRLIVIVVVVIGLNFKKCKMVGWGWGWG